METALLELDLKKRLREEYKDAAEKDINKAVRATAKHFLFVNKSGEIKEYEISDKDSSQLIKKALEQLPEKKKKRLYRNKFKREKNKFTNKDKIKNLLFAEYDNNEIDNDENKEEKKPHKDQALEYS